MQIYNFGVGNLDKKSSTVLFLLSVLLFGEETNKTSPTIKCRIVFSTKLITIGKIA